MTNPVLYQHALNFLARREHSRLELFQKLQRHSSNKAEIEQVLEQLQQEKLQNDVRFAESFIHHRAEQGYGWMKIRYELQQRGVNSSDYQQALEVLTIDWQEIAANAYRKHFDSKPIQDFKDKQKRMAYLQQRGFGFDEIKTALLTPAS